MPTATETTIASSSDPATQPHVVIIGAGFGGLNAAKALRDAPVRVTVVDRRNHHLFQALLYQVATAVLSPANIAQPIRGILRGQKNISVLLAEVTSIDLDRRELTYAQGTLTYDALILAAGASHAYFGHDDWEANAPGLKTLEDALDIRRRILLAFEEAEREPDAARRQALMTFVVVGGGPTGVELAGAIAELARHAMAKEFDRIDPTTARIILMEAADRVLLSFPASLSQKAAQALTRLGVEIRTNTAVTGIEPGLVRLADATLPAATVLWAAGVRSAPVTTTLGVPLDRAGRIQIERDLSLPGHPEAFAIGDLTVLTNAAGKSLPGTAPVAIQQGRWVAANAVRRINGEPTKPFRYRDRGSLATIGRNAAVADIRGLRFSGFPAWLIWAVIHIYNLIGFRNRILVALQWTWSYLTFNRGARLITETARANHSREGIQERHNDTR